MENREWLMMVLAVNSSGYTHIAKGLSMSTKGVTTACGVDLDASHRVYHAYPHSITCRDCAHVQRESA